MTLLDRIDALSDDLKTYFNTNVELVKLQAIDRVSEVGASAISVLIIAVVGLVFLIMASLTLALYLALLLGAYYIGFGIVAGLYLVIGIILLATRQKSLQYPLRDIIVKNAMAADDQQQK